MGCASSAPEQPGKIKPVFLNFSDNYDVAEKIGSGSFAQVRSCVCKRTNAQTAVKIVTTDSLKTQSRALRELEAWTQVGAHPNVVVLLGSYAEASSTYFVMQRCKCSVNDMLACNAKGLANGYVLDIFHQAFLGLQHCHSMEVVHRDVKAANLLVDFNGTVKLADFGLSLIMQTGGISGVVGSTPYMSPEMVRGKSYGFETDVWSCAALMYFVVYGEYPYDAPEKVILDERKYGMMKAIATDKPKPRYVPADGSPLPSFCFQELIQSLLQRHSAKRPDAGTCAKLILTAKSRLECTRSGSSLKSHRRKVDHSTESTRDTNAVVSEASSSPVSENSLRDERLRRI